MVINALAFGTRHVIKCHYRWVYHTSDDTPKYLKYSETVQGVIEFRISTTIGRLWRVKLMNWVRVNFGHIKNVCVCHSMYISRAKSESVETPFIIELGYYFLQLLLKRGALEGIVNDRAIRPIYWVSSLRLPWLLVAWSHTPTLCTRDDTDFWGQNHITVWESTMRSRVALICRGAVKKIRYLYL